MATQEPETSQGKRVSAYDENTTVTPIYRVTNLVSNGDFSNGTTGWTVPASGTILSAGTDPYIANVDPAQYVSIWQANTASANHKYYFAYNSTTTGDGNGKCYGQISYYYNDQDHYQEWIPQNTVSTDERFSQITTAPNEQNIFVTAIIATSSSTTGAQYCNTDDVILIDLTSSFGAGNEPSKEWCDANLRFEDSTYFDGAQTSRFNY